MHRHQPDRKGSLSSVCGLVVYIYMTTKDKPAATTLSIRDFTRSGKILQDYDYIDIEDRKSHQYKGVFVSGVWAEDVKNFLNKKIESERQKKTEKLMGFAGLADGDTDSKTYTELAAEKEQKYE